MGWIPPPRIIDQRTFDERIRNGARTLEEIDPEFWRWHKERERDSMWSGLSIVFAVVLLLGTICAVRLAHLARSAEQAEIKAEVEPTN